MKSFLTFLCFVCQLPLVFSQNWELDFNNALKTAQESDKTIILVFSGSDWCAPCIRLEEEIWATEVFKQYAEDHYVMVRADFPRRKANKLPKDQEKKNGLLAEQYNPNGEFPSVVIIDKNRKVLGHTRYKKLTPKEYISHLNGFIR